MSEQHSSRAREKKGDTKRTTKGKPFRKVIKPATSIEEGGGVSKIKAALRQTRRLLAKESISASVRQEGERKLIALEDELKTKELQQKEKNNAQRYHKVRFFERQKLVRKIKKLKRAKEQGEEGVDEKLYEERVLLNYVLHYPMTQKYVALFPNKDEVGIKEEDASVTQEKALKVKERIIECMKNGELSKEPELELESRTKEDMQKPKERKRLSREEEDKPRKQQKKNKVSTSSKSNLADDDFFAAEEN